MPYNGVNTVIKLWKYNQECVNFVNRLLMLRVCSPLVYVTKLSLLFDLIRRDSSLFRILLAAQRS